MTIRVFLLDDHALVRTGMRMMLSAETDIEVVGEADAGETALPMIRKLKPDVVLCDLHLPGISGLEVTERIVKGDYGSKVVVVSVLEDGPIPKRLIEVGASGYVGKGGDAAELLRAVRDVARGKRYLANGIAQHLALAGIGGGASPFDALSPRELEVAMLLVQGMRQEDIAKRLNLSAKTVNTHKARLFEKLQIQDTIALAFSIRLERPRARRVTHAGPGSGLAVVLSIVVVVGGGNRSGVVRLRVEQLQTDAVLRRGDVVDEFCSDFRGGHDDGWLRNHSGFVSDRFQRLDFGDRYDHRLGSEDCDGFRRLDDRRNLDSGDFGWRRCIDRTCGFGHHRGFGHRCREHRRFGLGFAHERDRGCDRIDCDCIRANWVRRGRA
jgi:two-component system, NarL family, invasion response regulator UvrY